MLLSWNALNEERKLVAFKWHDFLSYFETLRPVIISRCEEVAYEILYIPKLRKTGEAGFILMQENLI
jgi:hypothetical protein